MKQQELEKLGLLREAALQRCLFQVELARVRAELSPFETSFDLAMEGARLIQSICEHDRAEWRQPGLRHRLLACLPNAIALSRAWRGLKS
jgi:hypothetical protein